MRLVGIAGLARTGKDTAALHIIDRHGFVEMAYAAPLKQGIGAMFGLTDAQLHGDEKDAVIPWLGVSSRELCQRLGAWARSEVRHDVLVVLMRRWLGTVPRYMPGVVLSDVRMEIEADFIRDSGGSLIHITRDAAPAVRDDVTENGIAIHDGDVVVSNNGTLDELYAKLDDVLRR